MENNGDGVNNNGNGVPVAGNVPAAEPVVSPEVAANPAPVASVAPTAPTVAPVSQKKSNGTLIAIIIAVAVVLITVITVLVVVLVNNNSSKSQSNRGGSHYEEDEEDDDEESGSYGHYDDDDEEDDNYTSSVGSVSCLGHRFEKQSGYRYTCEGDGLEISGTTFAMYIELLEGMSYYQAEGHADELAAQLSQGMTVNSHRKYTAANGRKMLVFDVDNDGMGMYVFITAASTSSVLVVQTANDSGRPVTADLETAADLLSDSTVASRLPDGDAETEGEVPAIDWNQYLQAPELQK